MCRKGKFVSLIAAQRYVELLLAFSWIFLQFKEFELYWGAVFFTTRRGVLDKSFFKINFIGVNFEAGNETREKICSDFVADQNEEWSEKRVVFCSYRCFLESEKLRCGKNSVSERFFLFTCGILKQVFWLRGLVMILS